MLLRLGIRNYPGETPIVQIDGSGGFICGTGQYLEISGFEISGPNASIIKSAAEAERASVVAGNTANNYYKGRGIAVWASSGGHHILFHSNKVHHAPASGIRINNSDYCTITNNEVYECTTWSHAAESSLVLAQSKQIDTDTKIKMRITKKKTYDNVIRFITLIPLTHVQIIQTMVAKIILISLMDQGAISPEIMIEVLELMMKTQTDSM